jgi:Lon protease-like protein
MKLPLEAPVMPLPNATLFPQALLPLFIFEPRYRRMLTDMLDSHRMFVVAMQKPGNKRESPTTVAGLGLIRASVEHADGTSHLILQGLTRVELGKAVRYRPYRVHSLTPLQAPPCDNVHTDALVLQVRDLLTQRFQLGLPLPFPVFSAPPQTGSVPDEPPPSLPAKEILDYLDKLTSAEQVADLVSCALLQGAVERQTILETVNVETRLQRLIRFLLDDIRRHRQKKSKE